jgi:TonB-dependent starch-binding outer membrane protein SusC
MKKNPDSWIYEYPILKKLIMELKIAFFLILVSVTNVLATSSYSQSAIVSLDMKNKSLEQVMDDIEKQSEFYFIFNQKQIDVSRVVSIQAENERISNILKELFKGTRVNYAVLDRKILLTTDPLGNNLLADASEIRMQQQKVTGTVTDGTTGESLPGVNVLIEGTTKGAITDANGTYSIELSGQNPVLDFSFVGYLTQKVPVSGQSVIDIKLDPDITKLEEVVVVGYGTQKKSLVTGAISSIKEKEISAVSVTGIDQVLQGRLAGVSVMSNSGMPGEAMRVRIRGIGSNGNSDPLYVVDGIVVGNLNNIDPSEIASMEVLKDAASSAIYGAQGANGVVMVTTKTGKNNMAPSIDFEAQYGSQTLRDLPKLMNATQYTTYLREAGAPNVPDPATVAASPSTDWMKEVINPATTQRYSLNISGGSEKSTYLLGAAISSQQGIIGGPKAEFTRYAVRLNSDHKLKPWLNIGERVSYSNNIQTSVPQEFTSSVVGGAVMMDPMTPVVYTGELPDNVQNAIAEGYKPVMDDNGKYFGIGTFPSNEFSNPLAVLQINHTKNKTYDFAGNVYVDIEPIKGLKFTSRLGIDSYSTANSDWTPSYWLGPYKYSTIASVYNGDSNGLTWQWENFINYGKTIGNHSFNILGGMSALKSSWNSLSTTGRGLPQETENFADIDYVTSTEYSANGSQGSSTLASYYGRVQYEFAGKYLFNSTIRRDGSSVMAPGHQWGTFPSVSVGWILTKEDFFSSLIPASIINYLKVRGSWGENGSISNVTVGAWNSMIKTGFDHNYPINDQASVPGAEPNNLPNYDLKWETSEQTDIGLDIGFFNSRITVTADYFNKMTKDLLTPGVAPGYTGFGLPYINGGDVRNRGFEFELGFRSADKPFKYDVSFNITTIDNKVTYLNPAYPRIVNPINRLLSSAFEKGYPIWYFYGYKTAGIFQNQTQIDDYVSANHLTGYEPKPGDPIVVNTKDDGLISTDDMTYIGSPYANYNYGVRINLSYKGFDFMVFGQGLVGNKIALAFNRTDFPYANKLEYWYTERWTGENSTNSWFRSNVDNPFIYTSDLMLFNASYMRIKQLQLGYTLPKTVLQKIRIKNLRLYVSLDDYFTFTKYPGMDPEGGTYQEDAYSVDNMMYPVSGKLIFGLNVNL